MAISWNHDACMSPCACPACPAPLRLQQRKRCPNHRMLESHHTRSTQDGHNLTNKHQLLSMCHSIFACHISKWRSESSNGIVVVHDCPYWPFDKQGWGVWKGGGQRRTQDCATITNWGMDVRPYNSIPTSYSLLYVHAWLSVIIISVHHGVFGESDSLY